MSPHDERARLVGFLAFYDEHPSDSEWEEAVTAVPGKPLFGY